MARRSQLGGIALDVVRKDIKNVHLSVYPPTGTGADLRPARMSVDTIRLFAISKLGWIKQQQRKLREQERESAARVPRAREPLRMGTGAYLLKVVEEDGAADRRSSKSVRAALAGPSRR